MRTVSRFALLLTIFFSGCAYSEDFRVHSAGFGPIKIGMPVKQASHLLGTPLEKLVATYQDDRYVVYPKHKFKGISFVVSSEGTIENVYIAYDAPRFKTDRGGHIGSTAKDLRRLYGKQIEVKAYQCADAFLIYTYRQLEGSENYGIVYTVNDRGEVEGIMSGKLEAAVPPC